MEAATRAIFYMTALPAGNELGFKQRPARRMETAQAAPLAVGLAQMSMRPTRHEENLCWRANKIHVATAACKHTRTAYIAPFCCVILCVSISDTALAQQCHPDLMQTLLLNLTAAAEACFRDDLVNEYSTYLMNDARTKDCIAA